jgi:hypothetical protein
MSLFRPIHWYHSRADLIWPVGTFHRFKANKMIFPDYILQKRPGQSSRYYWIRIHNTGTIYIS